MANICTSCNREIAQGERGVRFQCPSCSNFVVWRCEKCRRLTNSYVCPQCGFKGP